MNINLQLMLGKINAEKHFNVTNRARLVKSKSSAKETVKEESKADRRKFVQEKYGKRKVKFIVKEMYEKGMTNAQITRLLSISAKTVTYHLKTLGLLTHNCIGGPRKKVLHYINGEFYREYESIADATRETGLNHKTISYSCKGKMKRISEHTFKFGDA